MLTSLAAKFIILDIPTLHPKFDIHASNGLDTESTYIVVTRNEDTEMGKSFMVRLHFYRLGLWRAGILRMVGKRYRQLWVGPMRACA